MKKSTVALLSTFLGLLAVIGLSASAGRSADRPNGHAFHKLAKSNQETTSPNAFTTILSGGVLSKIYVGDDASFQVEHSSFPGIGQFYPAGSAAPADFGVFLRDKGTNTLYGTAVSSFTPNPAPWSPLSLSPVTGTGTSVDPYTVTVVSDAGSCFRLTMTVTYASTEEFFRHRLSITNLCGQSRCFDLYLASDIYLANSDLGLPSQAGNGVGGLNCPAQDYRIMHIPVTPSAADHFVAADYVTVWTEVVGGAPLSDSIQQSSCPGLDNAAALQWRNQCIDSGATLTIDAATSFGQIPVIDPVGACCLVADCSIATESDCQAAGGFYWGDGTICTPTSCWVQISGCKFNDLNGDGDWDQGEPTIPGVPITINTSPVPTTMLTNTPDGCFDFLVPAGTYTVMETIPPGMVQTAPRSVTFRGTFPPAASYYVGDFGNTDSCLTAQQFKVVILSGLKDDFAFPSEPSSPSQVLTNTCTQPNGANNFYDVPLSGMCLGHTFSGFNEPECLVSAAELCLKIKNVSDEFFPAGDISFLEDAGGMVTVWKVPVSTLGLDDPFEVIEVCLNLANLPPGVGATSGVTNVLAALQDGDFDVKIEGLDLMVDYLELRLRRCCPCDTLEVYCCAGRPDVARYPLNHPTSPGQPYPGQIAVTTCYAFPPYTGPFVLDIVDLSDQCTGMLGWSLGTPHAWEPAMFRNEGQGVNEWNIANLGTVFGLTLDAVGNIYTSATSVYPPAYLGPGTGGEVWRLDGVTGAISMLGPLPNTGQGLGNITYDCQNDVLYVSNHEDGLIYCLFETSPGIWAFGPCYDHGISGRLAAGLAAMPDDGLPGYTDRGRRIWAVEMVNGQLNGQPYSRLFYGVWWEDMGTPGPEANEIWSVGLDLATGAFMTGTARREIILPVFSANWSNPPADLSFTPDGKMLVAERSICGDDGSNWALCPVTGTVAAHHSRLLEYTCENGVWTRQSPAAGDIFLIGANKTSSAGGVDIDYGSYQPCQGKVWGTADALHYPFPYIYGLAGFPQAGGDTDPANGNCLLIDLDVEYSAHDKIDLGDVEVPCPVCWCGNQGDLDGNGFIDAVDLAIVIDLVFFGGADVQDSGCPTTRGDFNYDGAPDAVDLAFLIDHIFFGGPGPVNPCSP